MKKLIKLIVAGAFLYSGLWRLLFAVNRLLTRTQPAFILMYHRVVPEGTSAHDQPWLLFRSLPGIVVSPEMFKRQIAFLTEHFSVISLETLIEHIDNKKSPERPSVVMTFDDGWRDNYEYALPVLKHASAPATIFLSTGFVGTTRIYWPERLLYLFGHGDRTKLSVSDLPQELLSAKLETLLTEMTAADSDALKSQLEECIKILKSARPEAREELMAALLKQFWPNGAEQISERVVLDWNEIKMMQMENISFGSHGVNHELFTKISGDEAERELRESAGTIVARLHPEILTLAYPNGNHNEAVRRCALELGYRCAVTVKRGVASTTGDIMTLPRINIHNDVSKGLTGNFSPALFAWHINRAIL
jgi:peptidoglycan/xylan/chitin deacetylase (PgdA/CDA1 family)